MIIDFKAYSEIICEPNSMLILRNMKTSIIFNESQKLRYYENVAARLRDFQSQKLRIGKNKNTCNEQAESS